MSDNQTQDTTSGLFCKIEDEAVKDIAYTNCSILAVLATMEAAMRLMKFVHYNTQGEAFYGTHLLADKIDFTEDNDRLKEVFYLGERMGTPPNENVIGKIAEFIFNDSVSSQSVEGKRQIDIAISALILVCSTGLFGITNVVSAGLVGRPTISILDGISQKFQLASGLFRRVIISG